MKDTLAAMTLIMQLGAIVVTSVFVTLALGLWIDRRFGIFPCGLLIFMLIGITISIIGVYRTVQHTYNQHAPPEEGSK